MMRFQYSTLPGVFMVTKTHNNTPIQTMGRPFPKAALLCFSLLSSCLFSAHLAAADGPTWRTPDPAQTVYLDTDAGGIVIELAPQLAPKTVEQFLRLVREGFYDGQSFYRVIDGFVAQGGDGSDLNRELKQPTLPAEAELSADAIKDKSQFVKVQSPDFYAHSTGYLQGFPAAHDAEKKRYWPIHCPATVAMARDDDPASSSTDFYIVIGQAPRYLDRNLNIFGRVIYGMDSAQRIKRGPAASNGVFDDHSQASQMLKASVAADLPKDQRLAIRIEDTTTPAFQEKLESRRHRNHTFFHHKPPAVLDICQVPIAVKLDSPSQ